MKKLFLILFFLSLILTPKTFAKGSSFVSVVNPVRGGDFWDLKNQKVETAVLGQIAILNKFKLPATWLLRYDALGNQDVIDILKERVIDEKGLFLEITPTWASEANVGYRESSSWHSAGSAFLTGYEQDERKKLIDVSFEKFKSNFGYYPVSVGAWWIDSFSLGYMQEKYKVTSALIVADQYSTDNYQIWGQYFGTPYYPSKNNALHPAQTLDSKLDIVMVQWAPRDPVNGYGNGVIESTFSVQANDYIDYHDLDIKYFSSLIDKYTKQEFNEFGHLVVGLENTYQWDKYSNEYEKQIEVLSQKKLSDGLSIVPMKDFSSWYKSKFPNISPTQILITDDPLGSYKKTVWFMNPYYRAGWFFNSEGSVFRDIRQYIDGQEELCLKVRCDSVNFATTATRVLDEVSFGHKLVIDQGKISNFKVERRGEEFIINYTNEAGKVRKITFLPRDIKIDETISTIDGLILNATKFDNEKSQQKIALKEGFFSWSAGSVLFKVIKFLSFLILACLLPGYLFINKIFNKDVNILQKINIAITLGFVLLTLIFYISSLVGLRQLIYLYFLAALIIFILSKNFSQLAARMNAQIKLVLLGYPAVYSGEGFIKESKSILASFKTLMRIDLPVTVVILLGTIFQQIPTFKSGLLFPFGQGFWGPNTHDGIWHIALINQLVNSAPPENPIFAGTILKNYHYFYDLLVASVVYLTGIPVADLLFRFFPLIFSLLLGIGTYFLMRTYFAKKIQGIQLKLAILLGLYLVYFAGSFGWIVEYIKQKSFGGESAFWANQSISFNLNPPFAISLVIIISVLQLLPLIGKNILTTIVLTILAGSLIAFKAYAGVLIILSLLLVGLLKRSFSYITVFLTTGFLSAALFLSNFTIGEKLIIFSPFWFIHSMIDSPDRVGWARLSLTRIVGLETKNWFKFFSAEVISFFIFLIGNLGTRFFAIFSLKSLKLIFQSNEILFLFFIATLSLLIPLFVIQAGNPWNTIQFTYYFLYISAIISALVLSAIFKFNKLLGLSVIILVVILTPINSWATANAYLGYQPHALISNEQLEGLEFLRSREKGTILTYPYDPKLKQRMPEPWSLEIYDSTGYVSALTQKSVYIEDEAQNQILLTDYKKRLVSSKDFFLQPVKEGANFLQENKIKYVYLPKVFNVRLDESTGLVKNIFENKEVVIYETNY